MELLSLFFVLNPSQKLSLTSRFDKFFHPIPDGEKLPYTPLATEAKPNFFILAFDFKPVKDIHFIPNLEIVFYDKPGERKGPF